MKTQGLILCVLTAGGAVQRSARAQSPADSAAIEAAVAQHAKSLASPHAMFDSRFGLTARAAERPASRTQAIARVLGLPVAHMEDVIGCVANCRLAGAQISVAVAFGQIKIAGDSAIVGVLTAGTYKGKPTSYEEEDILARTKGTWRFVRVGKIEES